MRISEFCVEIARKIGRFFYRVLIVVLLAIAIPLNILGIISLIFGEFFIGGETILELGRGKFHYGHVGYYDGH